MAIVHIIYFDNINVSLWLISMLLLLKFITFIYYLLSLNTELTITFTSQANTQNIERCQHTTCLCDDDAVDDVRCIPSLLRQSSSHTRY